MRDLYENARLCREVPHTGRRILEELAYRVAPDDYDYLCCDLNQAHLAAECGNHRSTINRWIKWLADRDYIAIHHEIDSHGQHCNSYELNAAKLAEEAEKTRRIASQHKRTRRTSIRKKFNENTVSHPATPGVARRNTPGCRTALPPTLKRGSIPQTPNAKPDFDRYLAEAPAQVTYDQWKALEACRKS